MRGLIDTVRAFWPMLTAAEGMKHFGVTGSSNKPGHIHNEPFNSYAATKYASIGIAESVAGEAASPGIGTTIFWAGLLNTRIWDGGRARTDKFDRVVYQPEELGGTWRTQHVCGLGLRSRNRRC